MSALTDYSEKLLLDWLMTAGAAARPTAWYVALFTSAPSDAGGGTEVTGAGYARKVVIFAAASTPGGATSNTSEVSWTAVGGSYGTVTHAAIFDALTGGNMLWEGALGVAKSVTDGDALTFTAGDINLTLA